MNTTNKYSILRSFLCTVNKTDFSNFLDNVNPDKLDYKVLISFFGGSHTLNIRTSQLLNKISAGRFDHQVLLYLLETGDHRGHEVICELIEKIPKSHLTVAEASLGMFF